MLLKTVAAVAAFALTGLSAQAEGWYVSGSIGYVQQNDSSNSGETGAFTTGNLGDGTTLDVAAGTDYGWDTEFDGGAVFAGEVGRDFGNGFRVGAEMALSNSDVDTHTNVTLGGGSIDGLDAAALAGAADPLGVSVGELVSDGQGDMSQVAIFANVYYHFGEDRTFKPYIGAGLGISDVNVEFIPSGVGIIDDGETKLAYQIKAGATFDLQNQWELFGEYAYRATDDIEVANDLFPGSLEIENQQNVFSIGARYKFGG
ncbi:MAG: outer membrane beta-barrel protein [Henriciella sp.]|nr:outer membrane beta-barrel protein [Henriciella sp.]